MRIYRFRLINTNLTNTKIKVQEVKHLWLRTICELEKKLTLIDLPLRNRSKGQNKVTSFPVETELSTFS